MRHVSNPVVRSFAVLAIVTLLTAPLALAAPKEGPGRDIGDRIVRTIKRLVVSILDEISIPHP
jgi:hypothetical protein